MTHDLEEILMRWITHSCMERPLLCSFFHNLVNFNYVVLLHHFSDLETQEPCAGTNVKTGNFRLNFTAVLLICHISPLMRCTGGNGMLRRAADEVH